MRRFIDTKTIFVHIPKAAGVSIIKSLYGENVKLIGHPTLKCIYKAVGEKNKNITVICFARNPYTRLASAYFFLKSGGMNSVDAMFAKKYLRDFDSFESFVMSGLGNKAIMDYMHFKPQVDYIDGVGEFDNVKVIVKKYENIDESYKEVVESIGFGGELGSHNITKSLEKNEVFFTDEMKAKIFSIYKSDFSYFGYGYEP
nr:sulfotransferase family 2 domain-containing protein [Motiliproteus sp. SC1-56]